MTSAAIMPTVTVITGGEEVGAPGRIRTFAPASGEGLEDATVTNDE
jgi:hypothetical protein